GCEPRDARRESARRGAAPPARCRATLSLRPPLALPRRSRGPIGDAVRPRIAVLAATALPWHRPGGLERHAFQLCRWLRKRGAEVDLYTATPERRADPFAGDPGFRLCVVEGVPFRRERFLVVVSRTSLYPLFALRMGRRVAAADRTAPYTAVIAQGMTG